MKLLVITDRYDDIEIKRKLYLEQQVEVIEFPSLDAIDLDQLNQEETHLFASSIYVENLLEFKPGEVSKTRDSIGTYKVRSIRKPNIKPPRIIIYTHNRPVYFRLTLNSIIHSIVDCPEVPITIVLNDPTDETLAVAKEFQDRYQQIDILLSQENAACGGMTIGMSWHRPEVAIGAEDDFILPPAARDLYPIWPYQFAIKVLNGIDRVGWNVSLDNLEYNMMTDWDSCDTETRLGWHTYRFGTKQRRPVLMCQLNAYRFDFWRRAYYPQLKAAFDSSLNAQSNIIACPYLQGYHIGWNRDQDQEWSKQERDAAIANIPDICHVKSLRTEEERTIVLDDIMKD